MSPSSGSFTIFTDKVLVWCLPTLFSLGQVLYMYLNIKYMERFLLQVKCKCLDILSILNAMISWAFKNCYLGFCWLYQKIIPNIYIWKNILILLFKNKKIKNENLILVISVGKNVLGTWENHNALALIVDWLVLTCCHVILHHTLYSDRCHIDGLPD